MKKQKRDTIEDIMKMFGEFTDGVRMIMLIQRGKEGGKNTRGDKNSIRKISTNRKEFRRIVSKFLKIKKETKGVVRIYSCVNKRDLEKAIRNFKTKQLEADYYDRASRYGFYLDIENRFLSSLMKPNTRKETKFLIDIDGEPDFPAIEKKLKEVGAKKLLVYETKNGWHIITTPFNPQLWNEKLGEIKKDGLLLLSY